MVALTQRGDDRAWHILIGENAQALQLNP